MTFLRKLEANRLVLILGLVIVLINLFVGFGFGTTALISLIFLLLLAFAFLETKASLYALCFLIPLATPITTSGGNTVNFPSEAILALLTLVIFIKYCFGKKIDFQFLKHPLTILLILDLTWMLLTSCTSMMPIVSFKRTAIRFCYLTVYYFMLSELFSNPEQIKKAFLFYALGLIAPILFTLKFHSNYTFSSDAAPVASQPFYNDHTIYGCALAFIIPILFFCMLQQKTILKKLGFLSLLILFIVGVLLSYSRAAWWSLLILPLPYFVIHKRIKFRALLYITLLTLSLIGLFFNPISNYFQNTKAISHKNDLLQHFQSVSNVQSDVSNKERINRWKCAYRMFEEKPIFGYGPGTYQFFYGNFQVNTEMTYISTYQGNKGHAHNEFLNYLSETGFIGALLFLSWMIYSIYLGMKVIYITSVKKTKYILLSVWLALLTYYFHAQFNGFIETDKVAMLVFASLALFVRYDINTTKIEIRK